MSLPRQSAKAITASRPRPLNRSLKRSAAAKLIKFRISLIVRLKNRKNRFFTAHHRRHRLPDVIILMLPSWALGLCQSLLVCQLQSVCDLLCGGFFKCADDLLRSQFHFRGSPFLQLILGRDVPAASYASPTHFFAERFSGRTDRASLWLINKCLGYI